MEDKYHLTFVLFYVLGVLTLLPSKFFTTATDYWMYKFRDPDFEDYSSDNRTVLQSQFTSSFSIVSNVGNMGFFLITLVFLVSRISLVTRIVGTLSIATVIFALTVVFVEVDTDSWQIPFFVMTLASGLILTASCAAFMVSLFELAARFSLEYFPPILSGQSICGIVAALVQIFTLSISASSQINGLIYFLIGMLFSLMGLLYFVMMLKKSEFFIYHFNKKVEARKPLIFTKQNALSVLHKIKYHMISMGISLMSSIMVFPSVTSLVVSVNAGDGDKWQDTFFVPVFTFLYYHLFDYMGRECAAKFVRPANGIIILTISIIQVAFVPMLMLCNAQPRENLPVVFNTDYAYVTFIIIFGFSHGYIVNLCVKLLPFIISQEEHNVSMVLMIIFMFASSGVGALMGIALVKAL